MTNLMSVTIDQAETIAKESKGGFKREPVSEGMHTARLFKIIDTGTQKYDTQWGEKDQRKVMFIFEVLDENEEYDNKDGEKVSKPKEIMIKKTLSFHEKASLPGFLKQVHGKKPTYITDVMNNYVKMQIEHKASEKDATIIYDNVVTIMNADDMANKPKPVNEDFMLVLAPRKFNQELFDTMPDSDWKTGIMLTPEYIECQADKEPVPFGE